MSTSFRYDPYDNLAKSAAKIYDDVRKAAANAGVTEEMHGKLGFTSAVSGCHGLLAYAVSSVIEAGSRKVIQDSALTAHARRIVKIYTVQNTQNTMKAAGLVPTTGHDASIFVSPGLGTSDEEGALLEREARAMLRALFRALEIIGKYSGIVTAPTEAVRS